MKFWLFLPEKIVKNLLARGSGRNVNSMYPEFRSVVDRSVVAVILNFYELIKLEHGKNDLFKHEACRRYYYIMHA